MIQLAYLQVGAPRHGICRYGRSLDAEGRRRSDLVVLEENIRLEGNFQVVGGQQLRVQDSNRGVHP